MAIIQVTEANFDATISKGVVLLDFWADDELQELEEIEATLPAEGRRPGDIVRVKLHARVTETGTLELEALPVDGSARWKVQFDVRGNAEA